METGFSAPYVCTCVQRPLLVTFMYSAVYSTAVYKPPYLSQLTRAVVAVALFPSTIKYIAFNMYIMFALLLQYTHFLVYVYKHFSMYFINNN